jgi:hypothetical protein
MDKFNVSPAYKNIVDFLYSIQAKFKGKKRSEIEKTTNECLLGFDNLF